MDEPTTTAVAEPPVDVSFLDKLISQIVDTFNFHLRMKVTAGGLFQMWHRLADLIRQRN